MKQMTFDYADYAGKYKQNRKELFLLEMDRVVQWKGLITLGGGDRSYCRIAGKF
jgi:IS5 family transposase